MAARRRLGRPPGPGVRYRELAEAMARKIRSREWSVGAALPSQSQLAKRFQVGERTVRLALEELKRCGLVAPSPRRTLIVQRPGLALSAQARLIVLVVSHGLGLHRSDPGWAAVHDGIEAEVSKHWNPFLIIHGPSRLLRKEIPPDLKGLSIRGLLLAGPFSAEVLGRYERLGVPVVLVDRPRGAHSGLRAVCLDNEAAMCDAVLRLAAHGHRRIAFVRRVHLGLREVDADSKERTLGFLDGLRKAGLEEGQPLIFNSDGGPRTELTGVRAVLSAEPRVTAAIAADPGIARQLVEAARDCGRRIPAEFSLVSFDRLGSSSPLSGPRVAYEQVGHRAVAAFKGPPREIRIPTEWFEGQSCAGHSANAQGGPQHGAGR